MEPYAEIALCAQSGRAFVVATVVGSAGSTPQKAGAKLLVKDDGEVVGTVGGGAVEQEIVRAARALFGTQERTKLLELHLTHDLGMCCGGKMQVFLEHQPATAELFVFGAGHVGHEIALLAQHAGFRVTVIDARSEWTRRLAPPAVSKVEERDPADAARANPGGPDVYFCVTTHDHPLDQEVVEALIGKPFAYLGLIGSRRKAERFRQRLAAAGHAPGAIERLRSPMGVSIGALSPQEIAVSVVAELIATRRKDAPRR